MTAASGGPVLTHVWPGTNKPQLAGPKTDDNLIVMEHLFSYRRQNPAEGNTTDRAIRIENQSTYESI